MGCGLAAKSSPRPSVVPDTLSGPGRLDAGSHVNLYGRAVGTCSGERWTGEFAREGTEEMSDMDEAVTLPRTHAAVYNILFAPAPLMASFFSVPAPLVRFNARFPLALHPPIHPRARGPITAPTLWIAPPSDNLLSSDVECLKWQAYLALRGLKDVRLRWDIAPEGSIGGALPNLHVPIAISLLKSERLSHSDGAEDGELLAAHSIPTWVDAKLGVDSAEDPLEGYVDPEARIESRAWVALLEGVVHAALMISQPRPSYFHSLIFPASTPPTSESLQKILLPPPPPLAGYLSFIPPTPNAVRINNSAIISQYRDAIKSLSERLGTDKWFLGSSAPTPLDALAFAYIHRILHSPDIIRIEVTRRVNLVAWEWRVRCLVRDGFVR